MSELLSAGLYRLRRAKLLWIVCLLLALVSTGYVAWSWHAALRYYTVLNEEVKAVTLSLRAEYMDSNFFTVPAVGVLLSSAVCAWELGAEYQDGAQRNKLAVGHKRRDVYLTALLFTVLTCVLLCLSAFLPGIPVMLLTAGGFGMGWTKALLSMAGMIAASAAFASLFTLLGLNIPHRAASAIVAIGLTLALMLGGNILQARLEEPPTYPGVQHTEDGETLFVTMSNPRYIPEGPWRDTLTLLADMDPGDQVLRYCHSGEENVGRFAAYAALFFALTSAAGLLIFRRKDLK